MRVSSEYPFPHPLPTIVSFTKGGVSLPQKVSCECLPDQCLSCQRLGHFIKDCPLKHPQARRSPHPSSKAPPNQPQLPPLLFLQKFLSIQTLLVRSLLHLLQYRLRHPLKRNHRVLQRMFLSRNSLYLDMPRQDRDSVTGKDMFAFGRDIRRRLRLHKRLFLLGSTSSSL